MMSARLQSGTKTASAPSFTPVRNLLVQRKCACGGSASKGGECEECAKKKQLSLQRYSISRGQPAEMLSQPSRTSLEIPFGHTFARLPVHTSPPSTLQTKLAVNEPGDQYEQEADRMGERVTQMSLSSPSLPPDVSERLSPAPKRIQRIPAEGSTVDSAAGPAPSIAEPAPEAAGRSQTVTAGLIVEDEAGELAPGQMRKSDFLDELRDAVCAAADAELAATGRSTEGCPYIERWIGYYRTQSGQHLARAISRYAPETTGITTARDYIPLIAERVRRAVVVWAATGQITGAPDGVSQMPQGGAPAGAEAAPAAPGVSFKSRDGGAREAENPQAIQAELGHGQPIEGGVRSRMESAFGMSFSHVRLHADHGAAQLSNRLNARAFTLGEHVAFGSGEYRPGTLEGDVLLAHELAHVVQQGEARRAVSSDSSSDQAMEDDADRSAVSVMARLTGFTGKLPDAKTGMTRLKSGLRLQRCPPNGIRRTISYQSMAEGAAFGGNCTYCSCERGVPKEIEMISRRRQKGDPCPPGVTVDWNGSSAVSATALSKNPCPGAPSGCMGPPNFID